MTIHEPDVRHHLDNWRFWVVVAYIGIAVTLFGLYVLNARQSDEAAKRVAIQRAAAQAEIVNCVNSVRNAPVISGFMAGQRALVTNSILSTTAALGAEPLGDPLRHVRLASLARLEHALSNLNKLQGIISSTTQTRRSCNQLAARLRVPPPFTRG